MKADGAKAVCCKIAAAGLVCEHLAKEMLAQIERLQDEREPATVAVGYALDRLDRAGIDQAAIEREALMRIPWPRCLSSTGAYCCHGESAKAHPGAGFPAVPEGAPDRPVTATDVEALDAQLFDWCEHGHSRVIACRPCRLAFLRRLSSASLTVAESRR